MPPPSLCQISPLCLPVLFLYRFSKNIGSLRRTTSMQVANFLCNGNYAVSGSSKACDVVEQIAKPDFKARMTVRLAVAGAFHTDFMEAAVDKVSYCCKTMPVHNLLVSALVSLSHHRRAFPPFHVCTFRMEEALRLRWRRRSECA